MGIVGLEIAQVFAFNPSTGLPLVGGKLWTYEPGTTTPKTAYQDNTGQVSHENPIILGQLGNASVYIDGVYDLQFLDANDNVVLSLSDVSSPLQEQQVIDLIEAAISESALGYGTVGVTASTTLPSTSGAKLITVDATLGDITITLPLSSALVASPPINFVRTDTTPNRVTITGNGSELVAGSASIELEGKGSVAGLRSIGTSWRLVTLDERRFDPRRLLRTSTGTATAYLTGTNIAAVAGEVRRFRAHAENTGSATLDGTAILKVDATDTAVALEAGDLKIGDVVQVIHDGVNWVLLRKTLPINDDFDALQAGDIATAQAVDARIGARNSVTFLPPVDLTGVVTNEQLSIPDGVKRLVISLDQVANNASADLEIILGTDAGYVESGYLSTTVRLNGNESSASTNTDAVRVRSGYTDNEIDGIIEGILMDAATNEWKFFGVLSMGPRGNILLNSTVTLPGVLDRIEVGNSAATITSGAFRVGYMF